MSASDDLDYGGRLWPEPQTRSEVGADARPRGGRSKVVVITLAVMILVTALVGIGVAVNASRSGATAATSIAPRDRGTATTDDAAAPTVEQPEAPPRVDIYVALISHLNQRRWRAVYVSSKLCNQFPMGHGKCKGVLSEEEQHAIVDALPGIDLAFAKPPEAIFSNYQENYGRYAHLILGPIVMKGDEAHVQAGYYCIYTCGFGTTYLLEQKSDAWRVTDQVGQYWIS